jgi:hypothetical protein
MLKWLSRRLVVSAHGRLLAVDLIERHGENALAIIDRELDRDSVSVADRELLGIARRQTVALMSVVDARQGWTDARRSK